MDKRRKWRGAIELGKDVLILLLACSALWMLSSMGLFQRVNLTKPQQPQITGQQQAVTGKADAVRPLRLTATLRGGEEPERCVVQYDDGAVDALFQKTAGILMETLSSAEMPEQVSRGEWERALAQAPGICFDFQGEIPLSVLSSWLGVEQQMPEALVRRMLLTVWEDRVALYYYDMSEGNWKRCTTQVVGAVQLENALEGLSPNGAYYAFEHENTDGMAADTVLLPAPEAMPVYTASNSAAGGRGTLEGLMTDLGFNLSGCVFYHAADEEVARLGSDTVRLSTGGVLEYHADEDGTPQFLVTAIPGESRMFCAVESCRQLLQQVAGSRCGQARAYLSAVEQTAQGWEVEFEYSLNAVALTDQEGPAASFTVRGDYVSGFTIRLRSYSAGEELQLILPPVQAAAAMGALELEGRELQLMYRDSGEDRVIPNWMAVVDKTG